MWVYHFKYFFFNVEIDNGKIFGYVYCFALPIA